MWRNPLSNRRFWRAAVLAAWAPLLAQASPGVAAVSVFSPQNVLLCGRSLQLHATAWNWFGGTVAGFAPHWQSLNPTVATVDQNGNVQGLLPGLATIQASDPASGILSGSVLRVEPLRIAITPTHPVLRVGASLPLTASALDANGKPLAGMRFIWTSGVTDVATVASNGTVSALKTGAVTISAALDSGSPGLNFSAGVQVDVLRKPDYQLTALISSDAPAAAPTLALPTMISGSGDSFMAAIGDLSNGGQGLILSSRGVPQLLGSAGQVLPGVNKIINRFAGVSVNSAGDVVAVAQFPSGCDSALLFYHQGQPPAVLDTGCGINITDRALANNGDVVYVVWNNGQHCYIHHANGTRTQVVQTGDTLSGSLVVGNLGRAMLTSAGAAILEITPAGASDQLWKWDGSSLQTMMASGGPMSSTGAQNFNFPVESATGEIYCLDYLSNGPVVLHYSKGTWNIVAQANTTVGTTQLYWLYLIGAAGADGSIAVLADSPNGTGVFSLNSGNAQLLLGVPSSANVTQLAGAGSGVYDAGRMFGTPGVYRLTPGGPQQVLAAGWQLPSPGTVGLLWDNIPERGLPSTPLVRQPGDTFARIVSDAPQPLVTPGSRVGGDLPYWLGSPATSPDGKNTVFSANTDANNAFMNAHDGRVDLIGDLTNHLIPVAGQTISWIDPNWSGPFAMNANQQFVAMANVGSSTSLVLLGLTAPQNQIIATLGRSSPAGPAYGWINQAAIDAAGDVAFPSSLADGSTGLFLYKNGQVQQLLRTGSRLQSKVVSGIGTVQFAGGKPVDYFWYQNGGSAIQAFDGTAWTPVVSQGDLLASGRSIDYFFGNLAANDTGDVAYEAQTQGYASLLVRSHDGRDLVVGSAAEPLPDGSWPISFFGFNITPQGNVIFAAESFSNGKLRLTLFNAAPAAP